MKMLDNFIRHTRLNAIIIWFFFALVFYTDFLTPLGFAHGILYVPVLIYAMLAPGVSKRFQQAVLAAALAAVALNYVLEPNLSNLPDIYILSNRTLSAGILLLTYAYFRKVLTLKQQNTEISKLEAFQRQKLNDFIDAMPIQIWSADASGAIDFVSSRLIDFSGKSREVILDNWLALLHPDDRETTLGAWARSVQTGEPYHVNFRLRRYDGAYIWFETQAVSQRSDQDRIQRWFGSSTDINDLLRLREESEQMAARLRHTVESITDAFFTLDHDFRFTYLNPKAAEVLGTIVKDLIDEVIWEKCPIGYDSPFAVRYRNAAQTKQASHFEEYFAPGDKWLDVNVYPSSDGLTVYFSDVTERREMEERLRESQKLEAVGHLTGGVAHDFNNLLTVILGNAEMLADLTTDRQLRAMAEMTLSAAQRGAQLTNRLLAFARRQPLDPKPTDLNQLVEAMQVLIRRTLPEHIEMEFALDPSLGITEIDAGELDTALLNLVVNARDAMQGGGKLTIETANAVLDSSYAVLHPEVVPGEYVMLCVSDTGTGMTSDTARRAFEPFFTTKPVGEGSGLGLSMVFGFTKQSGGHIKIYSEPGEGSSIKLYFPLVRDARHTNHQPAPGFEPVGGTEHILITEDDDLVLQHLEAQLCSLGYRVTATKSGPEALDALKTHPGIDLLLTDIIMPGGMNGRQLADRARALYPALKVLFSSGYTENAIVHHGRLDPGVDLLSKPYTRVELATKVRLVLQGPAP